MEPFTKEKKMSHPRCIKAASINIDLFCCCSVPDVKGLGPWIACDICDQWHLQRCEFINENKMPKIQLYTCEKCQI